MITEEYKTEKICLFCASDYHLEMILLPYIKERLENSKFVIFTENNLEETINILLTKINLSRKDNEKIKSIGWNSEDRFEILKKYLDDNEKVNIIINGDVNYIKEINSKIKELISNNVDIIDCFHIGDLNVDIDEIKAKYKYILNTQKI